MSTRTLILTTLALVAPLMGATAKAAPKALQGDQARAAISHYNLEKGSLAIEGYDPVSYFPEGGSKPAKGSKKITTVHQGVTYRFANENNKKTFLLTPTRYEPAFGGWCSYAMSSGDKVEIDPKSFLIQEGRLLLFYNGFLSNTRRKWNKEGPEKLMPKSDANWKKISGETRPRVLQHFNLDAGLALAGYDPTTYAGDDANPAKGNANFALVHDGVTYHFTSKENLESFKKNPGAYEPNYGGWCAWAMADGKKVPVDPKAFAVEDGRLYQFYNASKRDEWLAARKDFIARADSAWSKLTKAE